MVRYDEQDVFSDGEALLRDEGVSSRHEINLLPGVDGGAVTTLGQTVRVVIQEGMLMADSVSALQDRIGSVEALMDGRVGVLEDGKGRSWIDMIIVSISQGSVKQIGVRWGLNYEVKYVQAHQC